MSIDIQTKKSDLLNTLSLNLRNVTKLLVEIKWCCSSAKKVTWGESVYKCPSIDLVWLPWTPECKFLICRLVFRLGRSWKEASEYFRDANAHFSPSSTYTYSQIIYKILLEHQTELIAWRWNLKTSDYTLCNFLRLIITL